MPEFDIVPEPPEDKMIALMERIAEDLEKIISWLMTSAALLAAIVFLITLRTLIGR